MLLFGRHLKSRSFFILAYVLMNCLSCKIFSHGSHHIYHHHSLEGESFRLLVRTYNQNISVILSYFYDFIYLTMMSLAIPEGPVPEEEVLFSLSRLR